MCSVRIAATADKVGLRVLTMGLGAQSHIEQTAISQAAHREADTCLFFGKHFLWIALP
jgi:hypothetical protein